MTLEALHLLVAIACAVNVACALLVRLVGARPSVSPTLTVMLLLQALTIGGFLIESHQATVEGRVVWDGFQLLCDGLLAVTYLRLASLLIGAPPRWPLLIALAAVSSACAAFVMTSPLHGAVRAGAVIRGDSLTYPFELVDYLAFAEFYSVIVTSIGLIVRSGLLRHRAYRRDYLWLAGGLSAPLFAALSLFAGLDIAGERDLSPLWFGLSALVATWRILRSPDLVPLARDLVVEFLSEVIFVVDGQGRLVDVNAEARRVAPRAAVGALLDAVWPAWATLRATAAWPVRVALDGRTLEVRVRPVGQDGRLITARDVTELADANAILERRVAERTAELEVVNAALRVEVDERRMAERIARDNEAKFRAIFDNAYQLIGLPTRAAPSSPPTGPRSTPSARPRPRSSAGRSATPPGGRACPRRWPSSTRPSPPRARAASRGSRRATSSTAARWSSTSR